MSVTHTVTTSTPVTVAASVAQAATPPSGPARISAHAASDPRFSTILRASGAAPRPLDLTTKGAHYTVGSGDTLESIALRMYGNKSHCERIRHANAAVLGARGDVFAGMVLWLPPLNEPVTPAAPIARAAATPSAVKRPP
jgi:nucleoid-associated protein YgaU